MHENQPIEQKIIETLEKNYMPYAMSVIVSRALPEIDGFKPSHRKLLYTMYEMKLLNGTRTKSANVVGQTMKLNPHGDQAIYETMVRMARGNQALLHPFFDSKGNFGKQYSKDMKYAAARYTEIKLDKLCEEVFRDIDKDPVDFIDNYDGTMKEPTLLPVTFPNILINPNLGIAVGMASNICSFNLEEMCSAAIAFIKDENVILGDYISGPDFPTGGLYISKQQVLDTVLETGKGSFTVRSKYSFDRKNSCIEITEIPYTTYVEVIIDEIVELVKDGKIKDIIDIRDETDLDGLKITIDIKKSCDPDALMKKLFKLTSMQDTFSCNFNILIKGRPFVMGVRQILREWLDFRKQCVSRQTTFDIARKTEKLHLLNGLKRILLDIDLAVEIIRETEFEDDVIPNLMRGFNIDRIQADFIAEIKLRNLNKEYVLNRVSEADQLGKDIYELKDTLSNDRKIRAIIIKQIESVIKKYAQPRKTTIIYEDEDSDIPDDLFIEDYNARCFLTRENYLKKIPIANLRTNPDHKLKSTDEITMSVDCRNKADLLLFSNKQICYKLRIYEINESKASSFGEYLPNLLELEPGENIISIIATENYTGHVLFGFENGKAAKIPLSGYATKTNRKKLIKAYSNVSPLIAVMHLTEDADMIAISNINKAIVFNTSLINEKATKDSNGIQVMQSKKGSRMTKLKRLDCVKIGNPKYYRPKTLPSVGAYIKPEDDVSGYVQVMLDFTDIENPSEENSNTSNTNGNGNGGKK